MIEYDKIPVGIIQYKLIDDDDKKLCQLHENNIYEIDIFIGELGCHGRGIGQKTINILADYLFKDKKANLLVMCPLKENIEAIDCYKKCGFKIKGEFTTENTIGILKEFILMVNQNSLDNSN